MEAELKVKSLSDFTRTDVSLLVYEACVFPADVIPVQMDKRNKPKYASCCGRK